MVTFVIINYLNDKLKGKNDELERDVIGEEIDYRKVRVDSLLGLKINQSQNDVIFLKGAPEGPFFFGEVFNLRPNQTAWVYDDLQTNWELVYFQNQNLSLIFSFGNKYESMLGVRWADGYDYNEIQKKWSAPSNQIESKDKESRLFIYKDNGVIFFLSKGKVNGFGVFNPQEFTHFEDIFKVFSGE